MGSLYTCAGFAGGSDGKEPACIVGDKGSIPGSRRVPGEGNLRSKDSKYTEKPTCLIYSWPLDSMCLNCAGPLILQIFFNKYIGKIFYLWQFEKILRWALWLRNIKKFKKKLSMIWMHKMNINSRLSFHRQVIFNMKWWNYQTKIFKL